MKVFDDSLPYNHLKFYNPILTLKWLIWGVWGGFVIGLLLTFYHKAYLGEVVRRLIKKEATSNDSALTLAEIGIKPRRLLTRALKRGGSLRKYISVANPEECEKVLPSKKGFLRGKVFPEGENVEYDFAKMRLFIAEDVKYTAAVRYDEKKKISPVRLIVFTAVLTALAIGVTIAVPDLLRMLDNFITMNFD